MLYASTVERAAKPIQSFFEDTYAAGTWAIVSSSSGANRPLSDTSVIAGEFSVRKTSAGEAEPSWTIWLASSKSLPLRRVTLIPVSLAKPLSIADDQVLVLRVVDDQLGRGTGSDPASGRQGQHRCPDDRRHRRTAPAHERNSIVRSLG